mgnify:FL=1
MDSDAVALELNTKNCPALHFFIISHMEDSQL